MILGGASYSESSKFNCVQNGKMEQKDEECGEKIEIAEKIQKITGKSNTEQPLKRPIFPLETNDSLQIDNTEPEAKNTDTIVNAVPNKNVLHNATKLCTGEISMHRRICQEDCRVETQTVEQQCTKNTQNQFRQRDVLRSTSPRSSNRIPPRTSGGITHGRFNAWWEKVSHLLSSSKPQLKLPLNSNTCRTVNPAKKDRKPPTKSNKRSELNVAIILWKKF